MARGGFQVEMKWKNGILTSAKVLSKLGDQLKIKYGDITSSFETNPGQILVLDHQLKIH